MDTSPGFSGIDVFKHRLDVALLPGGERWGAPNDPADIEELVGRLRAARPALTVLEATGGFETAAVAGRRPTERPRPGPMRGSTA